MQSSISNLQFCWLSIDEGDNDPYQFLRYLIAALQKADEHIGDTPQAALESPQPPQPEYALTALINDIAALPATIVLVLDDYHAITSQAVHASLAFLLDHQPSNHHLVLLTRRSAAAHRRIRAGQLTERAPPTCASTGDYELHQPGQGHGPPSDDVLILETCRRRAAGISSLLPGSLLKSLA
jgi:hypothetical protein